MTVQPELDLAYGFTTSLPTRETGDRARYTLAIKPENCVPLNSKAEDVPYKASAYRYHSEMSGIHRSGRVAISIDLDEEENPKFDVLKNLASRRTFFADDDERLAVMRKCLVNASRIAIANGLLRLPKGYTLDDLHALKGFRWSWKAGCSMCPCSPAFTCPLEAVQVENGRGWHEYCNWFNFSFKVKQPVHTVYDFARIADPTLIEMVKADCGGEDAAIENKNEVNA